MATAIVTSTLAPPIIPLAKVPQTHGLLIVDHDRLVREACREAACSLGYIANATNSAEQALWFLTSRAIDAVLLDWNLPNHAAPQFLELLRHRHPECEVVVLINTGQIRSAVEAIRGGAFDCLAKPFGLGELKLTLETVSERVRQVAERRVLKNERKSARGFSGIIGSTPEMERLYRIIGKTAQSSHPVLILGESGTGKELVARSIHLSGPYRDKPFIPVDCGSLVPTLIESELFGHVKGAFTGAMHAKEGLLSMAEGGTIFLDEVGELPLDVQSKLLRAIQEREVRPVGSTKSFRMNARILAATNRDLELDVSQGQFRRDLYFRLNVLALRVPPLRDRQEDIRDLVSSFLEREAKQSGRAYKISDDALNIMMAYDWPGNVRELQNCIEQCCALNSGPVIHVADLPSSIKGSQGKLSSVLSEAKICSVAELERRAILGAIEQLRGDKLSAARLLGIGKTTLYRKLKEYGSVESRS